MDENPYNLNNQPTTPPTANEGVNQSVAASPVPPPTTFTPTPSAEINPQPEPAGFAPQPIISPQTVESAPIQDVVISNSFNAPVAPVESTIAPDPRQTIPISLPPEQPAQPVINTPVVGGFVDTDSSQRPAFSSDSGKKMRLSFSLGKKLLIPLVIIIVLLGGGGAGAYYGYYLPNKPDNVMAKVFANLVNDANGPSAYDSTLIIKSKNPGAIFSSITVSLKGGTDENSNFRLDSQVEYSAFKFSGSVIGRLQDKTLYVKLNELPSLLAIASGFKNTATTKLATKLNNNWVKISIPDLKDAGLITGAQADKANKCVDGVVDFITNKKKDVEAAAIDAYKLNKFLHATKAGPDSVNNVNVTKYNIAIDNTNLATFSKAMDTKLSDLTKSVDQACGVSNTASTTSSQSLDTQLKDNPPTVVAYVSGSRRLQKLTVSASSSTISTDVVVTVDSQKVDTATPSNILTIKDLEQLIKDVERTILVPKAKLLKP